MHLKKAIKALPLEVIHHLFTFSSRIALCFDMKLVALLLLCTIGAVFGGYKDFLCSKDSKKVFFPCKFDCLRNHGGVDGKCGDMDKDDYNCYCEGANPKAGGESSHCRERTDNWRNVCTVDCVCNHGAFGGYCDWGRSSCVCTYGDNKENVKCPAKTAVEFEEIIVMYNGPDMGLGDKGLVIIDKLKKNESLVPPS